MTARLFKIFLFHLLIALSYGSELESSICISNIHTPLISSDLEGNPLSTEIQHSISLRGSHQKLGSRINLLTKILNSGEINNYHLNEKINLELNFALTISHLLDGKNHFQDIKGLNPDSISMRNTIIFSKRFKKHVGMHELEFLDPFHRKHAEAWLFWCEENNTSKSTESKKLGEYFLWVENNLELLPDYTFYPSQKEREAFHLKKSLDGLLLSRSDSKNYNSKGRELFIIADNGDIFSGSHSSDSFHHSTLSLGLPVKGSGLWVVTDGKISELDFESGHYLPTFEECLTTIEYLNSKDVRFTKQWVFSYFKGGKKFSVDGDTSSRVEKNDI